MHPRKLPRFFLAPLLAAILFLSGCTDPLRELAEAGYPLIEVDRAELDRYLEALPPDDRPETWVGPGMDRRFVYRLAATFGAELRHRYPPGSGRDDVIRYLEGRRFTCRMTLDWLLSCGRAVVADRSSLIKGPDENLYLIRVDARIVGRGSSRQVAGYRILGLWPLDPFWLDIPFWREEP